MKYSFDKLFRNNMATTVHKAAKEKKAIVVIAAFIGMLSVQSCMKQTLEEYGSTNGSNDISFICKESNGNSNSNDSNSNSNSNGNSNGKENDKVTKTAPTTSLTKPIGLFAYKHHIPNMNTGAQ
ncbi:MAG: hypothetical protein ACTTGX_02075, partial [Candidatus Cryptobacteroides sp.]